VTSVQLLHDRVVRLAFDDGCEGVLDLAPRMHGPIFKKAASDLDYFRQVVVDNEAGTIVWPNGADLAPEVLHVEAATDCPDPWTRSIPRLALSLDREEAQLVERLLSRELDRLRADGQDPDEDDEAALVDMIRADLSRKLKQLRTD
jgi:hypothetical protein